MLVKELADFVGSFAPVHFQEDFDNSGLLLGDPEQTVKAVLISLDVTEDVVDEAIEKDANFILAHHPLIFGGLKSITGKNDVERSVIKALQNNIAVYSAHTSLDNMHDGVNKKIAHKLNLENTRILQPLQDELYKLVTFVSSDYANQVREGLFEAGAGKIGDYDSCSYNLQGEGTFRGGEGTNPFVGKKGELHFEKETRIETVFPKNITHRVLQQLFKVHPYEEVAYDIYPIKNEYPLAGSGLIGEFSTALEEKDFLTHLKSVFGTPVIKHSPWLNKTKKKVAVCGGSGSFLIAKAKAAGADAFVTADIKYHQFFEAENKMLITDVGHYESEIFTKEIFYERLSENFSTFAIHLSKTNTNPVNYL